MQVVTVNVTQWQFAAVCEALQCNEADPQAAADAFRNATCATTGFRCGK